MQLALNALPKLANESTGNVKFPLRRKAFFCLLTLQSSLKGDGDALFVESNSLLTILGLAWPSCKQGVVSTLHTMAQALAKFRVRGSVTQSAMHVTNKNSTRGALCKRPTRQGIAGETPFSINPRRPHRQRDLN